jgi:integrase
MARKLNKLTDRGIKRRLAPGRHSDGGGLYLNVTDSDARSWIFMWKRDGKRREMGLGSLHSVPLIRARERAYKARQDVADGRDPIAIRKATISKPFGEAADELIASMSSGWRSAKHRSQWAKTLGSSYCASLRNKQVDKITTEDVRSVLQPIWQAKHVTASRLRGRIERVLDFAKAREWRSGENPARWRGHLDAILPKRQKLTRGHHAAMPFAEVPAFMALLRAKEGVTAALLEFIVLTASRTGEARGARWDEVDLETKVWTVPASRMKGGREHRVPLSDRAMAILEEMAKLKRDDGVVFPGQKRGAALTSNVLAKLLDRMKVDATMHGFRSSLRDWAGEATTFPREIAEAALAHLVGDETERAYRRQDAIEKRRKLMEAWSSYCGRETGNGNVLPFKVGNKVGKQFGGEQ